jgi:hypothetical protein
MTEYPYPIEACPSPDCRKAVIWAITEAGQALSVDAAPRADGNVLLVRRAGSTRAEVVTADEREFAARFAGHTPPLRTIHVCLPADDQREPRAA